MATTKNVKLGQTVQYVGTKGKAKLALIVGTDQTVEAGTSLPEVTEGFAHLAVFGWRHGFQPRLNVPTLEARVARIAEIKMEMALTEGFALDGLEAELNAIEDADGKPLQYFTID